MHKTVWEITLLIMEKSWNSVLKFLWESCIIYKSICAFSDMESLLAHRAFIEMLVLDNMGLNATKPVFRGFRQSEIQASLPSYRD